MSTLLVDLRNEVRGRLSRRAAGSLAAIFQQTKGEAYAQPMRSLGHPSSSSLEHATFSALDLQPAPLWQTGAYGWAVWSACRGTPALFAQIARAAIWQIAHYTGAADCWIELSVSGDVERFRSPREFTDQATTQGQRQFSRLKISVRGPELGADITVSRHPTARFSWQEVPSVVLEVGAADAGREPQVLAIRQAIASAITRGTFFFFHDEPQLGHDRDQLKPQLQARVAKRRQGVGRLYLFSALFAIVVIVIVAEVFDLTPLTGQEFATISAALASGVPVAGRLIRARGAEFAAKWRRWVDAVFFPAVEVAERTPGQRALRLGVRLLTLTVAPFFAAVVKALLG